MNMLSNTLASPASEALPMIAVNARQAESLQEIGLTPADFPEVQAMAQRIDLNNPTAVAVFGHEIAAHTAAHADGLLAQAYKGDLEEMSLNLSKVVAATQRLNLNALSRQRSRIPVIGRWIDRARTTKQQIQQQFETVKDQVEWLLREVETSTGILAERLETLESMFVSTKDEYRLLGLHIAVGRLKVEALREHIEGLRKEAAGPEVSQDIADAESLRANLGKRINDLETLQHAALQFMPMIRMIQANNRMLTEKFHTIRELTIPAWKRMFTLALALNEQRNAVDLADKIDAATNNFMRRNADLLHVNATSTAKANQRLVIDPATLEQVQATLVKTIKEVVEIQRTGARERQAKVARLQRLRKDMVLTHGTERDTTGNICHEE